MKKIFSVLMVLLILVVNIVFADSGDGTYDEGYNAGYHAGYSDGSSTVYRPKEPKITITNKEMIEAEAGEHVNITLNFINDSEYNAYHLKITPVFDGSIFEYERPTMYESTASIRRRKEGVATFYLKVKSNVKIGTYELKFNMEYDDSSDEKHSNVESVFIKITKEKQKAMLTIDNLVTNPEHVKAGEKFNIRFNINNIGEMDATECFVKLTDLSQETFMAVNSKDSLYIGNIEKKAVYTVSFDMIASKEIKAGNHAIGCVVNYLDSNGESVSEEKTFYILDVMNPEKKEEIPSESKSSKPKIIIDSYSTDPKSIVAGDSIHFSFTFRNTNSEKTISNMKITISSEGAFMIAHGSNTFYIEKLTPRTSLTKSIDLNVKQDLTSSSYPVNISFDYEDAEGTSYVTEEVINLPVTEYSKLVINNANVFDCMDGQQTSLSFDYINMGKAKISNLTASVEGDFTAVQPINYIGNLEAGTSDYYDIQVIPNKEGEVNGFLILSFEDSSGKVIEEKKAFSAYAMAAFHPGMEENSEWTDFPSYEERDIVKHFVWWQFVVYGAISFVVTFLISKMITARIIRKKLDDEI